MALHVFFPQLPEKELLFDLNDVILIQTKTDPGNKVDTLTLAALSGFLLTTAI